MAMVWSDDQPGSKKGCNRLGVPSWTFLGRPVLDLSWETCLELTV